MLPTFSSLLLLYAAMSLLHTQGNPAFLLVQLLWYIWTHEVDIKLVLRQQYG
jgi:hypothetical protein